MTSLTPDTETDKDICFLSKAKYVEEKREILLEFSDSNGKFSKRFPFFPQLFISRELFSEELLDSIFSMIDSKKYSVQKKPHIIKFSAATFSDLKILAKALSKTTKAEFSLIEPERQFLLLQDWNYFDAFEFSENQLEKTEFFGVPRIKLDIFTDSLDKTFEDLLNEEQRNAKLLAESIALSKTICLPLTQLPETLYDSIELFFENNFFKNEIVHKTPKIEAIFSESNSLPNGIFSNIAELDFSKVWQTIFSNTIYNLGFESINCNCCAPLTLKEKNVLPNSLVKVKFLEDGVYFESFSKKFSEKFHSENPFKENRLRRKQEFFLKQLPIGPFFKNQTATILLHDAIALQSEEIVELIGAVEKNWFCEKKESFVSKNLSNFSKEISLIEEKISSIESSNLSTTGLFSISSQKNTAELFYLNSFKNFYSSFCEELIYQLTESKSKFYNPSMSKAIHSIQEMVLFKFKQFSEKNSSKPLYSTQNKAFIESETPLLLVKEFSKKEQLPMPAITAMHKKMVF